MILYDQKRGCYMATPKLSKEGATQVSVSLGLNELERLDAIAKRLGMSRSMLVRNLIRSGIDDLKTLERMGVVGLISAVRAYQHSVDEDCSALAVS